MEDSFNYNFTYDTDYPDEVCDKDDVVKFGIYVVPIFFSIVIILSLTGNILVLVILALYENLKSLTNIFILNLAISDLVFTTGLPFWAIYHIWGWLFSEIVCKIVTFVFFIGFYSSILFLSSMTIYRYISVVHPLSELKITKSSTGIFVSFFLWGVSIGAALPSLLYSSIVPVPQKQGHTAGCGYKTDPLKKITVIQQNGLFLFAFSVMAFCYIRILGKIRHKARSNTKNRAVKLVFSIVAVFFLGWVPYNVLLLLRILSDYLVKPFETCETSNQIEYAYNVCRLIAFSHCCLNPVFYALVGIKFRSHLKSLLHRVFICKPVVVEQQITMQNFSRGSLY